MTITDVNDGTIYDIAKQDVFAIYEQIEFRRIIMYDGREYDVTETFETLTTDIGGQPITGP